MVYSEKISIFKIMAPYFVFNKLSVPSPPNKLSHHIDVVFHNVCIKLYLTTNYENYKNTLFVGYGINNIVIRHKNV